ncbi:hypothetical protein FJY69_04315 [candidate division WOR-3 bacterium]|nr:hypothetical protein [candidate division WOR-3 bacterium]
MRKPTFTKPEAFVARHLVSLGARSPVRLIVALAVLATGAYAADTVWVRLYDGVTSSHMNGAADIAVGPDGTVYVCGHGEDEYRDNCDMLLVAYRDDGRFLDSKAIGGYRWAAGDMAHSLAIDQSGGIYIAGFTVNDPPQRGEDMTWARFALIHDTLARTWSKKTLWPGDDRALRIVIGRNDDINICGADRRDTQQPDISAFTVVRASAASGSILWSRSLVLDKHAVQSARRDLHPSFFSDWRSWENCATCLALTQQGNVVVAGFGLNGLTERDVWVMEFDSAGNRLWATTYLNGGPFDDVVFDLAIAHDQSIYVCGLTESEDNGYDLLVLRLADTGGVLNVYTYSGIPGGDDFATRLVLDDATPQNVYVTGASEHALRGFQVMTQKLSHDLIPLWGQDGAKFGWAGDDFGYDIAFNKCRAYVAGTVSDDVRLICYSDRNVVGGETLWTFAYDLPDHLTDWGACLCVTDTDHIYLAGECDRVDSVYNWTSMFTARLRTSSGGIQEVPSRQFVRCALVPVPFPGRGTLVVTPTSSQVSSISVHDVLGRRRTELTGLCETSSPGAVPMDLTELGAGLYLVTVRLKNQREPIRFKVLIPQS